MALLSPMWKSERPVTLNMIVFGVGAVKGVTKVKSGH